MVGLFGLWLALATALVSAPTNEPPPSNAPATTPSSFSSSAPVPTDEAAWDTLSANPTFRGMYEFHKAYGGSANDTREAYASLFDTAAERNGVTGQGGQWRTNIDKIVYALPDETSDQIAMIPAETTFTSLGQMTYYGTWVIVRLQDVGIDNGAWDYGFMLNSTHEDEPSGHAQTSFTDGVY
jgi:hypothetical protein